MDPLSVTASAVAILQLTTAVATSTKDYFRSVKNAPKEVSELLDELSLFHAVLERLRSTSEKAYQATSPSAQAHGSAVAGQDASRLPMLYRMVKADAPLAVCYDEMLVFKERLEKNESRLKKSLKWPFRKDEILAVVQRLRNLRSILDTAIASDQLALNVEIQKSILNLKDSLRTSAFEDLSSRVHIWLAAPDPSPNLEIARNKRQQDTGVWLLESATYLNWESSACSLLWLYGKAGSGKTVLSSTAIHSLLDEKTEKARVAYFFFDFQIRDKQLVQNFLNSVITQLFDYNHQTMKIIEQFYSSHSRGRTAPTIQDAKSVIRQLIDKCCSVYIIIDALDECEDRKTLLQCLEEFCRWKQQNLHILATSRRETDIEDCLMIIATDKVSLEESVVQGDILSYVRHQLRHDKDLSKWSEEVRAEIQRALTEGAQGMFRWVECQLNAVRGCLKLVHLRRTLKSLPKTLDETYARMLDAIEDDYVEDVCRILFCLVHSFHPLSIHEIADTIAIVSHGETYYDEEYRLSEPRDILRICSGLVLTTRSTRTTHMGDRHLPIEELRLAHYSVKEYLVSGRASTQKLSNFLLDERSTHRALASLCIRYLFWCHKEEFCRDSDFLMDYATSYIHTAAFAPYAAACWSRHFRAAQVDGSSPLCHEAMELVTRPDILRDIIRLHPPWFRYDEVLILQQLGYVKTVNGNYYFNGEFENVPPLYYAALLGIDQLVLMLIVKGEDINSPSAEGTCLSAAASNGHLSTVRLLIEKGATLDVVVPHKTPEGQTYFSKSAVYEAVENRDEDVLRTLLDERADPNLSRFPHGEYVKEIDLNTPLQLAIHIRHKIFAQLLINAGADVNAEGGAFGTAMFITSNYDPDEESTDVLTMLLDAGADPMYTKDPTGMRTPLFNVIAKGNPRGAQLLVERGAKADSIDYRIVPFIARAHLSNEFSFYWAVQTVSKLNPNINLEALLVSAAKYGQTEAIRSMLQNGANPGWTESNGLSALHAAAFRPDSDSEIIECYLNAGADINQEGGPFGSALQAAAMSGKARIVEYLLEKGANANITGGEYGSALEVARQRYEDRSKGFPGLWKPPRDRIESYGPDGYFSGENYGSYARSLSRRPLPPGQAPKGNINILHSPNADYQAVIDILLAHGAVDITLAADVR